MALTHQQKRDFQSATVKTQQYEFNHFEKKIDIAKFKKDPRMRFRNSKDPIYVAFDFIDRQPLDKLAKDFVKETIQDSKKSFFKFISFICQK